MQTSTNQALVFIEPEMVDIIPNPEGFLMGATDKDTDAWDDEKPQHRVILSPYAIGKYQVTFDEYDRFTAATGRNATQDKCGRGQQPVINVSWYDATDYCDWLSKQTDQNYRLLTEAEWKYAAKSGDKEECWAGTSNEKELGDYAWSDENSEKQTHPVGLKKPNSFGLYDMSGNVWEWCYDYFDKYTSVAMKKLGVVVADICKSPRWEECWCGKSGQTGGCRHCQTYQLFWGLNPTCGDKGIPEKYYSSMGFSQERTIEELNALLHQQKQMREKYKY